ncbi:YtxH domain-containing protein [Numidum massiliense]|uniref:YtxH domain-containing protein n=1 Tax=Numidum massiliense TaxID=1522315 RepID=UPI0006D52CFC|nr:YtxH domain-containing protein [Numidum massiliense]
MEEKRAVEEKCCKLQGKGLIVGAVAGAVIGGVTALLLAPKSGRDTRADLNRQWVTVKDKTQEVSRSVKDKTVEISQAVKDQSSEMISKFKGVKDDLGEELNELKDSGKALAVIVSGDKAAEAEDAEGEGTTENAVGGQVTAAAEDAVDVAGEVEEAKGEQPEKE